MIFFLDADGRVYARYGGRDAHDADRRQSLEGLHYTMKSVLQMHGRQQKAFAPRTDPSARLVRDLAPTRRFGRCMHCHQVKEALDAQLKREGKWSRDQIWRYPLPENLGLRLEVDRGNVVQEVKDGTPAAAVGLRPGDVVERLNGVPVHSFADAQYALDRAPKTGAIEIVWRRDAVVKTDRLALPEGWRKTDFSWRPSLRRLTADVRLYGDDLTPAERKALGLSARQLAFRQTSPVSTQAKAAGIRAGDIILGIDHQALDMGVDDFLHHVRGNYLAGDQVTITLLREGRRQDVSMTLRR